MLSFAELELPLTFGHARYPSVQDVNAERTKARHARDPNHAFGAEQARPEVSLHWTKALGPRWQCEER
jgi:hypothetical protein